MAEEKITFIVWQSLQVKLDGFLDVGDSLFEGAALRLTAL
jgi:hypothetical protein